MGKKILILANLDIGLYKFRKDLLRALMKQGHEVYISLPYGDLIPRLKEMGCHFIETPVDRRGLNPVKDAWLFVQYRKILKQINPELVITYTIKPNIYGAAACRSLGAAYAVNITGLGTAFQRESLIKKLVIRMYQISCKRAGVVFFENEENRNLFIRNKMVKAEKTCRLNGAGVNLQDYPYTEYPKEDGTLRFLFIGRVMKEKGVDELFTAFEKLKIKYPFAELDVVGPYEDNYKQRVGELVKQGVIRYHGYQEDVRPFLARCHCFVLPSWHEGMANTLLEAGAMGRPLIASDIAGCREAVQDGKNGFLAPSKNSIFLKKQLEKFINTDYVRKKRMGESSYQNTAGMFDKDLVVKATIRALAKTAGF